MKKSRFRQALARWLHAEPARDPSTVGRQEKFGAAILDVADWLQASGWSEAPAGDRQQYAAWLLGMREAYERQGAPT